MDTIGKQLEDEPAEPAPDASDSVVLGSLDGAPADSQLGNSDDSAPALPKGALVALRKSGGLRFTSRTVVIHRDGQVTVQSSERSRSLRPPARLNKLQLSALKRNLAQGMNAATPKSLGRQNPDAYAYEIVARVDRRVIVTEVYDGSIPKSMAGLVREMNKYLPNER